MSRAERRKLEREAAKKKVKEPSTKTAIVPLEMESNGVGFSEEEEILGVADSAVSGDDYTFNTHNSAMTDPTQIKFTKEELEKYATWKADWLKSIGKTEAQVEHDFKTLGKWLRGSF